PLTMSRRFASGPRLSTFHFSTYGSSTEQLLTMNFRFLSALSRICFLRIARSQVGRHPACVTSQSIDTVSEMSTGYTFSMNSSVSLNDRDTSLALFASGTDVPNTSRHVVFAVTLPSSSIASRQRSYAFLAFGWNLALTWTRCRLPSAW